MIAKLYYYFQVIGILSIVLWAGAAVLVAWYGRTRRQTHCLVALGLAALGMVLARVNSAHVSAIKLDQREEIAAAMKANKEAAEAESKTGSVVNAVKFAEGDPEEAALSYRKQGKQVRTPGKRVAKPAEGLTVAETAPQERLMHEPDLLRANFLDRVNLLLAKGVLWLALLIVVVDYLARLNSTASGRWPLPITGHWLDSVFSKTHAVLIGAGAGGGTQANCRAFACRRPGHADERRPYKEADKTDLTPVAYAERAVKKGESFIYFGSGDPWPGREALARVTIGKWPVWRLPKLNYGDETAIADGEYALDAAWFNRCGVVVTGPHNALPMLATLITRLSERHQAGAVARHTVHLMWALPQVPSVDVLAPLVILARDMNLKVAVWTDEPLPDTLTTLFEERFDKPGDAP